MGVVPVVVAGGVRTPFCRSGGVYAGLDQASLFGAALGGLVERFGLEGCRVDMVIGGAVMSHSRDWNLMREVVLRSALDPETPGIGLQQACGTGLQGVLLAAGRIASGEIHSAIVLGGECLSDAPLVLRRALALRLVALSRAQGLRGKLGALRGLRLRDLVPEAPGAVEASTGLSMGEHCELMAKAYGIGREAQDRWAFESHSKAMAAWAEHEKMVVPSAGVFVDDIVRPEPDLDALAGLRPSFDKRGGGTITAGNASALTDGAACVLLCSESWAAERGLAGDVVLRCGESTAHDFVGGKGLLMAPVVTVARMLERMNLTLQDFDFYEIHEAFAAQVLATLAAWEFGDAEGDLEGPLGAVERSRINVWGGSLALGHPFAATGCRLVMMLAALLRGGGRRGLISVCTAGGMGVAAILERR